MICSLVILKNYYYFAETFKNAPELIASSNAMRRSLKQVIMDHNLQLSSSLCNHKGVIIKNIKKS